MGLSSILRNAVKTIDNVTKDAQDYVQHYAWIGTAGDGEKIFAEPVLRKAIVNRNQRRAVTQIAQTSIQEMQSRATITIVEEILPNGAADRQEPIDSRDKFILPDGTSGPILDISGTIDPGTHMAYFYEVWLGWYI